MDKITLQKNILTPRERFGLLVIDEKPDRCNIMPLITSHAAAAAQMSLKKYYTSGKSMAQAQLIALEQYHHDAINIFSEVGIIAEAMGSIFEYPDNDLPVLKIPFLTQYRLSDIKMPSFPNTKRLPVYLEAIDYAYDAVGDKIPILAYVPAPFTTGMMLSDPNLFLMQTIKQHGLITEIMEISLQVTIEFCYHIIDAGALPILVDPLASSSVISPRVYRQFALPYEQKLIDFLHRYDLDIILHICGDTEPILDLFPLTGADLISIDRVDLGLVVGKISNRIRIVGNFSTSQIAFSTPRKIQQDAEAMVTIGKESHKGYIASTGCEIPITAPVKNVQAFVKGAKEKAWYWD